MNKRPDDQYILKKDFELLLTVPNFWLPCPVCRTDLVLAVYTTRSRQTCWKGCHRDEYGLCSSPVVEGRG